MVLIDYWLMSKWSAYILNHPSIRAYIVTVFNGVIHKRRQNDWIGHMAINIWNELRDLVTIFFVRWFETSRINYIIHINICSMLRITSIHHGFIENWKNIRSFLCSTGNDETWLSLLLDSQSDVCNIILFVFYCIDLCWSDYFLLASSSKALVRRLYSKWLPHTLTKYHKHLCSSIANDGEIN